MIRYILLITSILLIAACSTTKAPETSDINLKPEEPMVPDTQKWKLEILEITQGKMRKLGDEYVIYERTEDMVYEENDQCVYNKEVIKCLRHGFKIRYNTYGKDLKLNCIAKTNIAVNAGNTAQEKYIDTREDDFYMNLKGSESEFVNVQYISGQPRLEDLQIETLCSYSGNDIFQFKQRIRFK